MRLFRLATITALVILTLNLANAVPGAHADGDEDQAPPIPEKRELTYPNLGSHLDQLVARVEEGDATAEEAAGETAMHRAESVAVTIHLSGNVEEVVAFLEENGGDPRNLGEDYIEAYVPVSLLGPVSEQPGVLRVREIVPPENDFGDFTSQGVQAHLSGAWNQAGYTGRGVKVGVIDGYFGFNGFRELMGTELPSNVQARCYLEIALPSDDLDDCTNAEGGSEHGTWVAEAVIDVAPEVSLYIASPSSLGDLLDAVNWMISQDVKVIVRSEADPFDGPGDGTSPVSNSPLNTVDRAVDSGVIWVNAAGNHARKTWFGDYADADGDGAIEFGGTVPGIEVVRLDVKEGQRVVVQLRWEDDWDGASTDLDLLLYNTSTRQFTNVSSEGEQSGERGQVPLEGFWFELRGDSNAFGFVVGHYSGDIPDWIQLVVWRVNAIQYYTESGSIANPAESANPGMLAVGAAPWYDTGTIEPFSSRGPTPDGREKPDIVGADCGETALRPLNEDRRGFCGTSQAAPHVAGMAALVRQRFPDYTPEQVATYLKDNAEERGDPGADNTWGYGFAVLPPIVLCSNNPGLMADCDALRAARDTLAGTGTLNWSADVPIAEWDGVTVGGSPLRVTELRLADMELTGEIPAGLGSLANLEKLWLSENQLTGEIPAELGNLPNLVEQVLWDNELSGAIPAELGGLSNLKLLSISQNQLTGGIPAEMGNLSDLEDLYLWGNELTGTIPAELGSLANLRWLSLSDNQLTGEIPAELGGLANLEKLWLSENQLTGEISVELGNLPSLAELVLWDNELTGTIPVELGSLTNLELLSISQNQLAGEIPTQLGNLAMLRRLSLSDNQLAGEIPSQLGALANLEELYLWDNELRGTIPQTFAGLTKLESFSFYNNLGLCAPVDGAFQAWLESVDDAIGSSCAPVDSPEDRGVLVELHGATGGSGWANSANWLTDRPVREWHGVVTDASGRVTGLFLYTNQLSGAIPPELGNLSSLGWLDLSGNQLTGEIPSELGGLMNLTVLRLSGNQLTGCVPSGLGDVVDNDIEQLGLSSCDPRADLIRRYDANKNGMIDASELSSAIASYAVGDITASELSELINRYATGT